MKLFTEEGAKRLEDFVNTTTIPKDEFNKLVHEIGGKFILEFKDENGKSYPSQIMVATLMQLLHSCPVFDEKEMEDEAGIKINRIGRAILESQSPKPDC
jgi:hypothetical protein